MKSSASPSRHLPGISRKLLPAGIRTLLRSRVRLRASRPAGAAALLAAVVLTSPAPAAGAASRELRLELPADGISALRVTGGNGSVRVEAGDTDQVRVTISLSPKKFTDTETWRRVKEWFFRERYESVEDLIEAVTIGHDDGGRTLRIWLEPEGRSRESRVQEEWVITVPRRLAVEVKMDAADVSLSGVAGGIGLNIAVGDITADVPGGDARIRLSVGDVELRSGSTSIRELEVDSEVGKTRVWMNGLRMQYTDPPGPGSRFRSTGTGEDTISVRIDVGSSTVRINEERQP